MNDYYRPLNDFFNSVRKDNRRSNNKMTENVSLGSISINQKCNNIQGDGKNIFSPFGTLEKSRIIPVRVL